MNTSFILFEADRGAAELFILAISMFLRSLLKFKQFLVA